MRPLPKMVSVGILLSALALAGCGGSGPTAPSLSATALPSSVLSFKSRAVNGESLPAKYTCDGANISPPLEWGPVPPSTVELLVLLVGLSPTSTANRYTATVEWAVSGISPVVHRLSAGALPLGTHVGAGPNGARRYSVCPRKGPAEKYEFTLYALPASFRVSPSFASLSVLEELSKSEGESPAAAQGSFLVSYKRR